MSMYICIYVYVYMEIQISKQNDIRRDKKMKRKRRRKKKKKKKEKKKKNDQTYFFPPWISNSEGASSNTPSSINAQWKLYRNIFFGFFFPSCRYIDR